MGSVQDFIRFTADSPTAFHATDNALRALREAGYEELPENRPFAIVPGGCSERIMPGSQISSNSRTCSLG